MLTVDDIANVLPTTLRGVATQSLVDKINTITTDPEIAEQVRNNFISYTSVLRDGRFKIEDYLFAVMFVSHRLMGKTNKDSYIATFPDRYQRMVANGTSAKDVAAYVSAYSKGKLVNAILEQSLVPSWVLNQDLYQDALNTQADLMMNARSEMVRCTAASSILQHLTKPKEAAVAVNIDMRETSGMKELQGMLMQLAEKQHSLISNGISTRDIAEQVIIDMDADDDSN